MITFSVIIPMYNAEKYIEKCVNSILDQSFSDFEIIIVDNNSTDNSVNICNKLINKDHRIKLLHQPIQGVGAARNLGLHNAKGKYIQFLDSDDFLEKENLSKAYELLTEEIDLLIYAFKRISANNKLFKIDKVKQQSRNKYLYKTYFHSVGNKIFKNSIIKENCLSFIENSFYGEDTAFNFVYLYYANKIAFSNELYYCYNVNLASSTHKKSIELISNLKNVCLYLEDFCKEKKESKKYSSFLKYFDIVILCPLISDKTVFSPKTYRKLAKPFNIYIYTFRPDLFLLTLCCILHLDLLCKIYANLKYIIKKRIEG